MVIDLDNKLTKQIEEICAARGVRLTSQRKRVFELICASKKASSAYELLEDLKQSEPQAKPPTVYRALDFLMEQGFIHRVESTNSFISCCSCNAHKHFSQLLICDQCGNVIELQDDSLIALLANNAEKHGFKIVNHVIESHGVCQSCSSK
ncbi:zinc uptake transcriptional repressor Zur [Vibrio fluvialis]|jgi:Fur family zinc uptake transcriptional regulator|uniref:Ferric uptake regulation protein n=1 Tax=Vibrio fluvialis TaxID=676 RepID=A0AAX2LVL7_VIBFL|nr:MULTISPECIES: zinc uptake transcriptional repressor Zur [Vibrio]TNF11536.1 MAG: zinc uptake transcriptional repressor Zur [Vibrionaceae bacterium]AMF95471.1 transcriptional regulator Zur [Vibrio fluvialis]EKO3374804.1 zinc uptake transcriptional repressor Zur [Vibrio fluvialis]EKO3383305.1 zinc uptake transcriptional repressor Zur [Vibrio fluvialis]EKO3387962.1 zinc uptake transcriptional repressor Zur [Vibrio fluvialis]